MSDDILKGRRVRGDDALPELPPETNRGMRFVQRDDRLQGTDPEQFYSGNVPAPRTKLFDSPTRPLDEPDIELDANQTICGVCNLVYWKPVGFCTNCRSHD